MHVFNNIKTREGGLEIRRAFPSPHLQSPSPFLLFDHFGPMKVKADSTGVSPHPHRGQETVTYLFEGEIEHQDTAGFKDTIGPGEVQWMTAGSGIIHSEHPSKKVRNSEGIIHGIQLWLNIPKDQKMTKPKYLSLKEGQIPNLSFGGNSKLRVIAGNYKGLEGSGKPYVEINYWHLSLDSKDTFKFNLPKEHIASIYAVKNQVLLNKEILMEGQIATEIKENNLKLENNFDNKAEVIILTGKPLKEKVVAYGPFVMNTEAEIRQAMIDYQNGQMGDPSSIK